MTGETAEERAKRMHQRSLFDGVADLYDETRAAYPKEIIDELWQVAELAPGRRVLEVGCGTGQLTVDLARRGVDLTAIDLGPAMVAATRGKVGELGVSVENCAFEEFDAAGTSFAAVVSATAFHWIDPDVAWTKTAALLERDGWLAILGTAERYDDPLGQAFREQWIRYSSDGGAWATQPKPTLVDTIRSTRLFDEPLTSTHLERRVITPETMVRLEHTRATTLSYEPETRERFFVELDGLLDGMEEVALTQETRLTMARVK